MQSVLGYEVRKEGAPHDCLEDARAAMKLVLAKIEGGDDNNKPVPLLKQTNETDGMKLLCHRIPISIPGEKLLEILPGDFTIELKVNNSFPFLSTCDWSYNNSLHIVFLV